MWRGQESGAHYNSTSVISLGSPGGPLSLSPSLSEGSQHQSSDRGQGFRESVCVCVQSWQLKVKLRAFEVFTLEEESLFLFSRASLFQPLCLPVSLSLCVSLFVFPLSTCLSLSLSTSARVCRWCGESWVMQPDQSCPSDSTSLGTSSKGRCSVATRERERDQDLQHLHSPEDTSYYTSHHAVLPTAYSTQHSFNELFKTG